MACNTEAKITDLYVSLFHLSEFSQETKYGVNFTYPGQIRGDPNGICHGLGKHGGSADIIARLNGKMGRVPRWCTKFYTDLDITFAREEFLSHFIDEMKIHFKNDPTKTFVRTIEMPYEVGEGFEGDTRNYARVKTVTHVWVCKDGKYYEKTIVPDAKFEKSGHTPHYIVK